MTEITASRRNLLRLAGGAVAASAVLSANEALAYQGNMERALSSLYSSLGSLREATSDKGGHKAKAVQLIQQAIGQVQAGIDFAAERFGD
ncbi:hypothetical protein [Bosea sp. BK604]|uniref:hypothetical protein n=1 Tax=Bosea sp. BK604 TaxID=2512180 RepID=UPI0010527F3C|nr:hypothetical protein [Bosea sp. BK604]TCR60643.1 hypothetical protein EV560_116130 [Bosea sp. BK604]